MYLNGHGIAGSDARGGTITDDHFLLYFNADGEATITLPPAEYAESWDVCIDTGGTPDRRRGAGGGRAGADEGQQRAGAARVRRHRPPSRTTRSRASVAAARSSRALRGSLSGTATAGC